MQQTLEFQSPAGLPPSTGYSHIAKVMGGGGFVFISGQVARNAAGELVGKDDFRAQVEQAFANVRTAVEAAGGSMSRIVKLNYYCADTVEPAEYPAVAEIRDRYVDTERPPASTFVVVRRLVRADWLIEIEAVAAIEAAR